MVTQQYDDNVIINGTEDEVQLQVQGSLGQTEVLQTWEQDNGQVVAQVSANGRIQAGDISSTGDAIIEAYRSNTATLPERGISTFGLLTTFLSGAVSWLLSELEINSPDSFAGIFRALRGKVTFNSSGDASDADLRAGDFVAINQSGTSSLPVKRMSALQGFVDNQSAAYLSEANGVSVLVHNLTNAEINTLRGIEVQSPLNQGTINTLVGVDIADMDQGTANFALRTGKGAVKVGDVMHVEQQTSDPDHEADVVQFYAKGDKLYAKAPSPSNAIYDLTGGSGSSPAVMQGASPTVNGAEGLVPQSLAGEDTKFLKGDGTWDVVNAVGALNDLSDVDTSGAANGDVLGFDGTDWSPVAPSGGGGGPHTHTLNDISDAGDVASQNQNNVYFSGGNLDGVNVNNANFIGGTNLDVDYIKTGGLESENDGYSTDNHTVASSYGNHNLHLQRARGTIASPTAIQSGDILGRFSTKGYDGTGYQDGPHLLSVAEANWSNSSRKGKLELHVADTGYTRLAARLESSRALALKNKDSGVSVSSDWGWVKLWSDNGEMKVMDESGNVTTLSSHNPQLIDASDRPTSYVYAERNPFTGKYIEIDMFRIAQLLEQLTGEDLIHVDELPAEERLDWAQNEARQAAERALEIERWNTTPTEYRTQGKPSVYAERPEPARLATARAWRKPSREA